MATPEPSTPRELLWWRRGHEAGVKATRDHGGYTSGLKAAIAALVDMLGDDELSDETYYALLAEGVPVEGRD